MIETEKQSSTAALYKIVTKFYSRLFVRLLCTFLFAFFFVKTCSGFINLSLKAHIFLQNLRTFAPSKFNLQKSGNIA